MKKETPNTESVVAIRNLKKGFGPKEVLKDVSLDLKKQENLVVLGKSGTGKSVLIKCIVRLLRADAGEISVFGEEINGLDKPALDDIRKRIGFLFQSAALYDSMTVRENLEFPLRRIRKGLSEQEIDQKVHDALENVGLVEAIDKMPSELSGGMRKRIGLARTIIVDPEIILYDEPTTGLDPVTSNEISILINEIQQKYKASSIIITHDMECVRTVADRIIMLKEGAVYKEGSFKEFQGGDDDYINSFFKPQNTELNKN
ncbi:ABC transporter ATP-binding protein [Flavobacterium caeni]|uniref:Phospholipid/cholesterol/gamma-HCH transport system ATP-binding protein n=1 Tax=Flavobacterium caeni TaxID=490189 RepID=A0A1G5CHS7_9FLAO|nr:ATP-binding cassette domain-containing protein [Flavobacterium caeni]SCY01851.1 phospholipid/cholesterol/gamma-HCH transport system ATP-binding protein [Flavobacterium caeni]